MEYLLPKDEEPEPVDTDEIIIIDEEAGPGGQTNDKMAFFPKTSDAATGPSKEPGHSDMSFLNRAYTDGDEFAPMNDYPGESLSRNGRYKV